ncbi:hypothetical protein GJ496_000222 [Pomphorhynchus laevis]|nr:hypothetical protein GJ496_000222 [Pomphorhynchus laevis]
MKAIRELRSNPNIMILLAEKGNKTVVWSTMDHIAEGMRQFSGDAYERIELVYYIGIVDVVLTVISTLVKDNEIYLHSQEKWQTTVYRKLVGTRIFIHKKIDDQKRDDSY